MAEKKRLKNLAESGRTEGDQVLDNLAGQRLQMDPMIIYVNSADLTKITNRKAELVRMNEEARIAMSGIEDEVRFWRIMEEGAGIVLTGSGIILGVLGAAVAAPAGLAAAAPLALVAGSVLGALQLGSGFVKVFYLALNDSNMIEWMDNDKTLKAAYFIIDFIGVVSSIVGIIPALKSAATGLGPKVSQFRAFFANSKLDWNKIAKINREIFLLKKDLAKGIKDFKNAKFPADSSRLAQNAALKDLSELGAKLRNSLLDFKQEIRKWDKLYEFKIILETVQKDLIEPLVKLLQSRDKTKILDAIKAVFIDKSEDIENLVSLASLHANITPGHSIATGSLHDIKEIAPKLMDKKYREGEFTDDFNELMADLNLLIKNLPESSGRPSCLESIK